MTFGHVRLCTIALASLLTIAGCRPAPPPERKQDVATDTKALSALRARFAAAYSAKDAAAVSSFYEDDAILMLPNQAAIEGRPRIRTMFEAAFKQTTATIVHTPVETEVAGDWAYERGNVVITTTPKSGQPAKESIKYLVLFKRQPDGAWKVHRDISNSNNPPAGASGPRSSWLRNS
jgi:uncharacterized protein (TIGR02246 family)